MFINNITTSVLSAVDLLWDPVHVCDLFLVAYDLDGLPDILDDLWVRLPLLHHTWHDFLIHDNCKKQRQKKNIDQQLFCFCLINEQKLTGKQNTKRHTDCSNMAKITIMSITEMNCWLFNMIVQSFHQHQAFIGLEK